MERTQEDGWRAESALAGDRDVPISHSRLGDAVVNIPTDRQTDSRDPGRVMSGYDVYGGTVRTRRRHICCPNLAAPAPASAHRLTNVVAFYLLFFRSNLMKSKPTRVFDRWTYGT